jgi:tetrahydromethanopterin S-methyltransferase subunit G
MARMIAEVYDALKSAGAPEDQARAAATAVSGQLELGGQVSDLVDRIDRMESRFEGRFERLEQRVGKIETDVAVLKWMVGFTLAMNVAILFFVWQIMLRLPA